MKKKKILKNYVDTLLVCIYRTERGKLSNFTYPGDKIISI